MAVLRDCLSGQTKRYHTTGAAEAALKALYPGRAEGLYYVESDVNGVVSRDYWLSREDAEADDAPDRQLPYRIQVSSGY